MNNDIEPVFPNLVNVDEVGKYDTFVKHPFPSESGVYRFSSTEFVKTKFEKHDGFLAMENMQENLDRAIETELEKDYKLQSKIQEIQEKAKKRIAKLKEKPIKKLKKKFHYEHIENYFKPDHVAESSTSSESQP